MLKCIIVDDEQFSVDALERYIEKMPDMKITGVFLDPLQALLSLSCAGPIDVLFIDIDMPHMSGLELAKELRAITEKIIFTTSHSRYAFEAYEAAGDAYLLKPFTFAKFAATVNRMIGGRYPVQQQEIRNSDYFLVKSKEEDLAIVKVKYNDVLAFESAQNYIKIYMKDGKEITAYLTLKDMLQLLTYKPQFVQLHRSFIVSTDHISHIKGNQVLMSNQLHITVGDLYKAAFLNYLDKKLLVTSRKQ